MFDCDGWYMKPNPESKTGIEINNTTNISILQEWHQWTHPDGEVYISKPLKTTKNKKFLVGVYIKYQREHPYGNWTKVNPPI